MADKNSKKEKWTLRKEKAELEERLRTLRDRHDKMSEQKNLLYTMAEKAIEERDDKRIDYLRSEIESIKLEIKEVRDEYNNTVEVLNKLEEATTTRSAKYCNIANVAGGIGIGVAGLALTHWDSIKGFLKDKGADAFFQTAWRSMFGKKS